MTAPAWGEWLAFADAAARFLFLNWAFHATCLLAAGLLLSRLPRLRPAARHAVLGLSLALAALSPALHLAPRPASLPAPTPIEARDLAALPTLSASAAPTPLLPGLPPWTGLGLLGAWFSVAGARFLFLTHGSWSVGRWLSRARPADRHRLYDACGYAVADIPVLEAEVAVPGVAGIRRPTILLPRGMTAAADLPTLRSVLLHEEAHVRRHDPLALLLAEAAHGFLFWHPLAALARRWMEAAAEDACDAHVLARGVEAPAYARVLLLVLEEAAPPRMRPACSLGHAGGGLRGRVARILAAPAAPSPVMAAAASGLLALSVGTFFTAEIGNRPALPRVHAVAAAPAAGARPPARKAAARPDKSRSTMALSPAPSSAPALPSGSVPRGELEPLPGEREPSRLAEARALLPREGRCVVFVLDNSGSMRPYQAQAREEILARAARLRPGDLFNVVAFNGEVRQFAEAPVLPNEDSLAAVRAWMAGLPDGEGSDVGAGLARALAMPEVSTVVLLSDGQASRGLTQVAQLVELLDRENPHGARVDAVAPSPTGAGGSLLQTLSERGKGELQTIEASRGVEAP